MAGGRPPKYETPEQMQLAIDAYFDGAETVTVTGLALALGFDSREGLLYYEHEKPEFLSTIKRAKSRIEADYESRLIAGKGNVAGLIFNLKNNFGWRDRLDHEVGGSIRILAEKV